MLSKRLPMILSVLIDEHIQKKRGLPLHLLPDLIIDMTLYINQNKSLSGYINKINELFRYIDKTLELNLDINQQKDIIKYINQIKTVELER